MTRWLEVARKYEGLWGSHEGSLFGPPSPQSAAYRVPLEPKQEARFIGGHSHTIERHSPTVSLIYVLMRSWHPSAVLGRVRAAVVHSVNCVIWPWARPHVRVEGREVVSPTLANGNATAAIISVIRSLGLRAPAAHINPDAVFGRTLHAVLRALQFLCRTHAFAASAPTPLRSAAHKVGVHDPALRPAFTAALGIFPTARQARPISESFHAYTIPWNNAKCNGGPQ